MLTMSTLVGISLHKDNETHAESINLHPHVVDEDRLSAKDAQNQLFLNHQQEISTFESKSNNKETPEAITSTSISESTTTSLDTTQDSPVQNSTTQQVTTPKQEISDTQSTTQQVTTPEQENLDAQSTTQQVTTLEQETSDTQQTTEVAQTPARSVTESIPSSGMYIDGVSSQIRTYSVDGGQVPTYTPYAYWWNTPEMASHNYYLVDNSNSNGLGQKVLALHTGDSVYLNGACYHVTSSVTVYPGQYASQYFDFSHHLYIQTCYGANASDGMRTVILD